MYRDVQVSREAGEGEIVTTGIARVERLAWAMPGATASDRYAYCDADTPRKLPLYKSALFITAIQSR